MNEDQYADIRAQLAANEIEHNDFKRRLDNHSESLKKYGEILVIMERQSNAIESMGGAVGRVEKKVDSIDNRVAIIEKEPADKWKKTSWEILKYVVLAIVAVAVGWIIKTP